MIYVNLATWIAKSWRNCLLARTGTSLANMMATASWPRSFLTEKAVIEIAGRVRIAAWSGSYFLLGSFARIGAANRAGPGNWRTNRKSPKVFTGRIRCQAVSPGSISATSIPANWSVRSGYGLFRQKWPVAAGNGHRHPLRSDLRRSLLRDQVCKRQSLDRRLAIGSASHRNHDGLTM